MKIRGVFLGLLYSFFLSFCCAGVFVTTNFFFANQTFAEEALEDVETPEEEENDPNALQVLDPDSTIAEDCVVTFVEIGEEDERFEQVMRVLSNPDKLKVYEIVVQDADGLNVENVEGVVTLRIKLDEEFDESRINVYKVGTSGSGRLLEFTYTEEGFVEIQTSEFGIYAISQVSGFKPASPSGNGSNTIALVLIIVGCVALVVAVSVAIYIGLRKRKN